MPQWFGRAIEVSAESQMSLAASFRTVSGVKRTRDHRFRLAC
jgi:hypothetical protein